jgi:methylated-DNA-[protein]-cysteine S-methyltransferase
MRKQDSRELTTWVLEEMPIGWIAPLSGELGLRTLLIGPDQAGLVERLQNDFPESCPATTGAALVALQQLRKYFAGQRRHFDLQLDLRGLSDFSLRILAGLRQIPFGETVTYGELAGRAGRPRAARAVGRVMAGNPLPLVLPCHRVVGAGGALTGYSGGNGIATKQWLIEFEKRSL